MHKLEVLFILAFLFSCKGKTEQETKMEQWQQYSKDVIESHLKKPIILPDSALNIGFSKNIINNAMNQPFKILVNVDIDCRSCLRKFYFWSRFDSILTKEENLHIPIIMYINSERPKIVKEEIKKYWKGVWLYDSKYEFIDKNDLHDDRFQAVLINQNKQILLIGNPMHNEQLSELYKNTLISILKKYETKKNI